MKKEHNEVYRKLRFNITYSRRMKGLTQLQLAEMIGISRTHMSNIEAPNGKVMPSLDVLIDIAEALDVPLSKLFEFKDLVRVVDRSEKMIS